MKKIVGVGLLAGLLMLVVGMTINQVMNVVAPSLLNEYKNSGLFRPWSDPIMSLFFLHPFMLGIILAWVWTKVKEIIKGNSAIKKGLMFGLIYWLISLPGMLITYSSFPVSLAMVFSWTFSIFIEALLAGTLFGKMLK